MAMPFSVPLHALGGCLKPKFLCATPPVATLCCQYFYGSSAKISADPQVPDVKYVHPQHLEREPQKTCQ